MNQLTQIVIELQGKEKNSYEYELLFADVYAGVQSSLASLVNSFSYSLKGDIAEGESVAASHLMKCVDTFKYEGYEFLTFFKKTLKNRLIDLERSFNAEKVRHNTSYEISLSMGFETGELESISMLNDEALIARDGYQLETEVSLSVLLDEFAAVKPVEAGVVELYVVYSADGYKKSDLTNALASYYGVEKYDGKTQRKASRAKEAFKKFAIEKGFKFNF